MLTSFLNLLVADGQFCIRAMHFEDEDGSYAGCVLHFCDCMLLPMQHDIVALCCPQYASRLQAIDVAAAAWISCSN